MLYVTGKKPDNQTNLEIYTYSGNVAQQFKFVENADGSFLILTKASGDASCVEIVNAETANGANVQQYERNGHNCQSWILEPVAEQTTTTTTTITTTTTTITVVDPVLYGDVDSDKSVTVSDIVLLARYVSEDTSLQPFDAQQKKAADCDGSGIIDATDVSLIARFLARMIPALGPAA